MHPARPLALVAASLAVAVALVAGPAAASTPFAWSDAAAGGPTGQAQLVAGEWVFHNGVFRSRGANADGLEEEDYFAYLLTGPELPQEERDDVYRAVTYGAFGAERSAHNGDYLVPTDHDRWPDFTGEVAQVRLAIADDTLHVRFRFTSMPRPDAQVATLTFAAAGSPPATARDWPRRAGVRSRWTHALTTWGTGAELAAPTGTQALTAVAGDHTVDVAVPLGALPEGPWTLTGGAGLADPDDPTGYWVVPAGQPTETSPGTGADTAPGANLFSLLFVDEDRADFTERRQAALLAGGDVSAATATVDPADLVAGRTAGPALRTGAVPRAHASRLDLGDGIVRGQSTTPPIDIPATPPQFRFRDLGVDYQYLNDLQPYWMYVPASYDGREERPLVVYLHGLQNYLNEPFGNLPGLTEELEARGWLFASLLGRGDHFYRGVGEVAVEEVLADIVRSYRVDPRRVYLMGHSMGGYGTHNIATRYPDRFAAIFPAQGTDSAGILGNLRHVPWLMTTSVEDIDPGGAAANEAYQTLSDLGYDATLIDFTRKTHEYSSIYDVLPRAFEHFASNQVDPDPAVVTYGIEAGDSATAAELGLDRDGAYWVDAMAPADPEAFAGATVTSDAIAHRPLDPAAAERVDTVTDEGGPSGRSEGILRTTTPAYGSEVPVADVLHLSATNLSALTVDATRAGLAALTRVGSSTDRPLVLSVDGYTGGVADTGHTRRVAVRVDGEPAGTVTVDDDAPLRLDVPAGDHVIDLAVVAEVGAGEDGGAGALPATGGGLVAAGLAGLAAAVGLRRPRRSHG